LRGQINQTQNEIVTVQSELKRARTNAELQGDLDKSNTAKSKRHLKNIVPLPQQRVLRNVFDAWKNAPKGLLSNIESNSINRDIDEQTNYFKDDDNIDVVTKSFNPDDATIMDSDDDIEVFNDVVPDEPKPKKRFECVECDKNFASKQRLESHIQSKHS
jgi:hypothetical protein